MRPLPLLHPGYHVLTKLDREKAWKGPVAILRECSTMLLPGAVTRMRRDQEKQMTPTTDAAGGSR